MNKFLGLIIFTTILSGTGFYYLYFSKHSGKKQIVVRQEKKEEDFK